MSLGDNSGSCDKLQWSKWESKNYILQVTGLLYKIMSTVVLIRVLMEMICKKRAYHD